MKRRVRIVLFTDSLHPSGVGRVMETLARHLSRERYALFLACAAHSGADELARRMAPHVAAVARYTIRDDHEDLYALRRFVRQLQEWQVDIFHNHIGATWEGGWGTLAARCARVPTVLATDHLPNVLRLPHELEYRRRMNRLLDRIFTVSESVRQSLLDARLAPAQQVVTVENGIDGCGAGWSRAEARAALGLPSDSPVVLFLGRLVEQKDPHTLLRAAHLLAEQPSPPLVLLAGDGPLRAELEELVEHLAMRSRVRFLGERRDVGRLLAAADVLAVPSRFEGLPLAVLEAMSAGLPIVGCEAPGVLDAVAHGVNGWLAPVADHEELARGILLALAPQPGARWARASRRRYLARFTARAMAERHEVQYAAPPGASPLALPLRHEQEEAGGPAAAKSARTPLMKTSARRSGGRPAA